MQARTPGSPSTFIMQFGQSPVMHEGPRRRWYFSDRVNVRIPARNNAEATVSPGSTATRRPSNRRPSATGLGHTRIDPVRHGVASEGHPAPASEGVIPPLPLGSRRVLSKVDPREVLDAGGGERPELSAEREFLLRPWAAPRAGNQQAHRRARLRSRRTWCAAL